ncbi:PH domain-containing protein, partial [Paenarthrobacter sp. RAF9]
QYVDVAVGPVERSLGLCTLKLHTASAGTHAHLPGLPAEEGARLREQLSARGEARLAGL